MVEEPSNGIGSTHLSAHDNPASSSSRSPRHVGRALLIVKEKYGYQRSLHPSGGDALLSYASARDDEAECDLCNKIGLVFSGVDGTLGLRKRLVI